MAYLVVKTGIGRLFVSIPGRLILHQGYNTNCPAQFSGVTIVTTVDVEFLDQGPLGERVPESLLRRAVRAVRIAMGDIPAPKD